MKHIMIDLEMNDIAREYKEQRQICKREVIEIGAAMLNDEFEMVNQIRIYVKPQYNTVTADIIAVLAQFIIIFRRFLRRNLILFMELTDHFRRPRHQKPHNLRVK